MIKRRILEEEEPKKIWWGLPIGVAMFIFTVIVLGTKE